MEKTLRILLIDDDEGMLKTLNYILTDKGYEVVTGNSGKKAIELIQQRHFDIALLDIRMPEMDGVQLLKEIKRLSPQTNVMMITAYTMHKLVEEAKQEGAQAVFAKPLDLDQLISHAEKFRIADKPPQQIDDLKYQELLQLLEERDRELKEKSLLIDELKKSLLKIKENPSEMLEQEKRIRQGQNIDKLLKPKQLALFKLLYGNEVSYPEMFNLASHRELNIRDLHALRLQISRLNKKLIEETNFRIQKVRRNKTCYLTIPAHEMH